MTDDLAAVFDSDEDDHSEKDSLDERFEIIYRKDYSVEQDSLCDTISQPKSPKEMYETDSNQQLESNGMNVNDDGFYDEALKFVFRWLTFREKINCEFVCQRWKCVIRDLLAQEQYVLFIGQNQNYHELDHCNHILHDFNNLDVFGKLKDPKNRNDIVGLFSKVPNLKSLYLADHSIDVCVDYLVEANNLCPNLECINVSIVENCPYFSSNGKIYIIEPETLNFLYNYYHMEINRLGEVIQGSRIKHLSFDIIPQLQMSKDYILDILIKYLKPIERITMKGTVFDIIAVSQFLEFTPSIQELILTELTTSHGLDLITSLINEGRSLLITSLTLKLNDVYYDKGIISLIYSKICNGFINLKNLDLTFDLRYTKLDFPNKNHLKLSPQLGQLTKLKRFNCHVKYNKPCIKFSINKVESILWQLTELSLTNLSINHNSFNEISVKCPNIEVMKIDRLNYYCKCDFKLKLANGISHFCCSNCYSKIYKNISELNNLKTLFWTEKKQFHPKSLELFCKNLVHSERQRNCIIIFVQYPNEFQSAYKLLTENEPQRIFLKN